MKLIKPYYQILTPINGEEILKQIELAARTCYQSEGNIEDYIEDFVDENTGELVSIRRQPSARKLIPKLIANHHEAMLEFGGMITVRFVVDRGVTHELVRHRLCSFAQESTRYCNYGKDEHITFIIPNWFSTIDEGTYVTRYSINFIDSEAIWFNTMLDSEYSYNYLIKEGKYTPQQARSVLPNSLKSEINVSANIREWRHILKLRTVKTAHPQMREVMIPLLHEFQSKIPILFDDIKY